MAYIDAYKLSTQEDFLGRIVIALLKACSDVMSEDNTTPSHASRVAYASKVLADPDTYSRNASKLVMTNPGLNASFDSANTHYVTTSTDSDLQFTVNSLINALAGVSK